MDSSFNKIISFVLGLIVVIVFFAIITGRININRNIPFFSRRTSSITPTLTPTPQSTIVSSVTIEDRKSDNMKNKYQEANNKYLTTENQKKPTTIPAAGLPTFFVPLMFIGFLGGYFLKKTK